MFNPMVPISRKCFLAKIWYLQSISDEDTSDNFTSRCYCYKKEYIIYSQKCLKWLQQIMIDIHLFMFIPLALNWP